MTSDRGSSAEPESSNKPSEETTDASKASEKFSAEEEASLLQQANTEKQSANSLFSKGDYSSAIQGYLKALAVCPSYFDHDVAVLRSNISACHIKLSEWQAAVDAATEALEALDNIDPPVNNSKEVAGESTQIEEVDEETAAKIEAFSKSGKSRDDVQKLRTKALLRRAKAREELGGWATLQGAEEDYKQLARMPNLTSLDQKTVQNALRTLPQRLEEAKQSEIGDMMGKLKQLGNGILKPFGLSTDNFNFVKDEGSGGYSMQFNQNQK